MSQNKTIYNFKNKINKVILKQTEDYQIVVYENNIWFVNKEKPQWLFFYDKLNKKIIYNGSEFFKVLKILNPRCDKEIENFILNFVLDYFSVINKRQINESLNLNRELEVTGIVNFFLLDMSKKMNLAINSGMVL
jgi:hypothetical protein